MATTFIKVEKGNELLVNKLSKLASEIVKDYYDPLLGAEQNDYMVEKFQSKEAMLKQLENGYNYFLVISDNKAVGFIGMYPKEDYMYLSKLYLHKDFRGRHIGKDMFDFVIENAKNQKLRSIVLNVNKQNPTIGFYEKIGMKRVKAEINDIGCGYVMDDYVYELSL